MRKQTGAHPAPKGNRPRGNLCNLQFVTGARVQCDGIYRVTHEGHNLPREVTLLAGSDFPKCSRCGVPVSFVFVRAIERSMLDSDFRICLYALPVIPEREGRERFTIPRAA